MKNYFIALSLLFALALSACGGAPHAATSPLEIGMHAGKISFSSVIFSEAMAADSVPPALQLPADQDDPAVMILNLITNWKTMGGYALASALAVFAGLMVRAYVQDKWKYKRLLMAGISLIFGFAKQMAVGGVSVPTVLVSTLITYGAAKYIYDELRDAGVIHTGNLASA